MGLESKINKLVKSHIGFNGATSITMSVIDLNIYSSHVVCSQNFLVIDEVSLYNGVLGRPLINKINAVTSATH